jgi:hypothetical protein
MQGIVIQGPTEYYKEMGDFYSQFDNIVWSTWEDEPNEHLDYISNKGIPLILNKKPDYSGYLNLNYQCHTTFSGINYFKKQGFTEVIKLRSDIIFTNINLVLPNLSGREIAFLNLNNPVYKPYLAYYLDYYHIGLDFPSDHIVFGKIDNMFNAFNYYVSYNDPVPPESIILRNYLLTKGNNSFEYNNLMNQGVYLFARDCEENKCQIIWLKNKWNLLNLTFNPHENFIF